MNSSNLQTIPGNILIVDDTPANLQILSEMLTGQGHTVRPVRNGRLALKAMEIEHPDLVLLDIKMPGMNGYVVCETMKSNPELREIPVVFLSALNETEEKVKGFAAGGVDYITKPFQIEEVTARISIHLEFHRLQSELKQSEKQYRILTDHMSDLIWSMNSLGKMTFISPSTKKFTGYSQEEIINTSPSVFLQEESFQLISDYSNSFLKPFENWPKEPLQLISRLVRKDHTKVLTENLVNPVFDEENGFVGVVGITRDITERYEAEMKSQQQERTVAVFNERERIGRELHDNIGQVFNYVNSQTYLIQGMVDQNDLGGARVALARLSEVAREATTDVREFIWSSSTVPIEIGFFDAIRSLFAKFNQISGIHTLLTISPDIDETIISPLVKFQLLRIIQETLTNTRKYSQAQTVQVIFTHSGSSLQVLVMDDGVGFNTQEIRERNGMHFGIDIMHERAQEVGANLQVSSSPGKGTQVIIQFPPENPKQITLKNLKFFLVDDHPLTIEGLKELLRAHSIEVIGTARNGEDAVDQVKLVQPDVVLMDLNLPGIDGVESTRLIKKALPDTQVVFLTLSIDDRDITRAIQAGASGYLLKNQEPEEFIALLERLVNGESCIAPEIMNRILYTISQTPPSPVSDDAEATLLAAGLTAQQVGILKDVVQGKEYKQIALEQHISPHTVKYHFGQILNNLKLTSRSEAFAYAYQIGLVKSRRLIDG